MSWRTRKNLLNGELMNKIWTEMEKTILKKYYFIEGIGVRYRLPNKSRASIYEEIRFLGLDDKKEREKLKYENKKGRVDAWTEKEKEILKEFYPDEGAKTSLRFKNRTTNAVYKMASKIGIKCNKKVT